MQKTTFSFLFQSDFVEKNRNIVPHALRLVIQKSRGLDETANVKPERTIKSSASILKYEIDNLIERLKKTVRSLDNLNFPKYIFFATIY